MLKRIKNEAFDRKCPLKAAALCSSGHTRVTSISSAFKMVLPYQNGRYCVKTKSKIRPQNISQICGPLLLQDSRNSSIIHRTRQNQTSDDPYTYSRRKTNAELPVDTKSISGKCTWNLFFITSTNKKSI